MEYLYFDEAVQIDAHEMTIFNYYFPSGLPKKIKIKNIKKATPLKLTRLNGKYRTWGMGLAPYWFNMGYRADKEIALLIDTGNFIKSAITPRSVEEVLKVLNSLGVK